MAFAVGVGDFTVISAIFKDFLARLEGMSLLLLGREIECWQYHQMCSLIHLHHHSFSQINLLRQFSSS